MNSSTKTDRAIREIAAEEVFMAVAHRHIELQESEGKIACPICNGVMDFKADLKEKFGYDDQLAFKAVCRTSGCITVMY